MTAIITADRFPHHPASVPNELKNTQEERWVLCDEYKVPLIAMVNGACYAASSTNPDTWRSYETALTAFLENEHFAGIGRVIAEDEDYCGVDLDRCLDPATGEISPWAATIVERLDSYAEISPSLTGVKIWIKAPGMKTAYKKPGLEVYPRGRYFTVTGLALNDKITPISVRGDELSALIEEEFPKVDRDRTPYNGPERILDLDDFLERADAAVFAVVSDGAADRKYRIRCPWLDEHSDGDESGTYTGQYENGALFFSCWHSHCARRAWREFRHHVESVTFLGRAPRARRGRLR